MERRSEQESGRSIWTWLMLIWCAFILYVLSIGPTAALVKNAGWPTIEVALSVYAPVIWLYEHTPLKGPLDAYVRLWGVH